LILGGLVNTNSSRIESNQEEGLDTDPHPKEFL
jgi:hypothetical protein